MDKNKKSKTVHEAYARFFSEPSRESFRALLKEHAGELRNFDFKEAWPDFASVAKHILGLGNSGGGCLAVGVRENADKTLDPVGVSNLTDKSVITNGVKNFLPASLLDAMEIGDFSFDASEYGSLIGKKFQIIFIHPVDDAVPLVAQKDGQGIRAGAIYVRREGLTEEARYDDVQRLIKLRLDSLPQTSQARDLKEHLEDLKVLYAEVPRSVFSETGGLGLGTAFAAMAEIGSLFRGVTKPNPAYPKEDYQSFVLRLLEEKKKLVERTIGTRS